MSMSRSRSRSRSTRRRLRLGSLVGDRGHRPRGRVSGGRGGEREDGPRWCAGRVAVVVFVAVVASAVVVAAAAASAASVDAVVPETAGGEVTAARAASPATRRACRNHARRARRARIPPSNARVSRGPPRRPRRRRRHGAGTSAPPATSYRGLADATTPRETFPFRPRPRGGRIRPLERPTSNHPRVRRFRATKKTAAPRNPPPRGSAVGSPRASPAAPHPPARRLPPSRDDHTRALTAPSLESGLCHVRRGGVHRGVQVLRAADRCPRVRPPLQRHHGPERLRQGPTSWTPSASCSASPTSRRCAIATVHAAARPSASRPRDPHRARAGRSASRDGPLVDVEIFPTFPPRRVHPRRSRRRRGARRKLPPRYVAFSSRRRASR